MNEDNKNKDCLEPENNSKCCFFKVANAFLLLFVFLLFIVSCWYAPRVIQGKNLGFDYMGVIVAILAALITVLITWQIWITISSKEEVKKATDAVDDIKQLQADLETLKNRFTQHNLEIQLLIDAHAKLQNVDYYETLSDKYLRYADALEKLIQSNVDFSYDKFDDAFDGLGNVLLELNATNDPVQVLGFIEEENQYDHKYENILTTLAKREKDIDDFRKRLAEAKRLRLEAVKLIKETEMGKKIEAVKKEYEASKREAMERLQKEAEEVARKAAEAPDPEANPNDKTEEE